jgi:hypothetical protein
LSVGTFSRLGMLIVSALPMVVAVTIFESKSR